MLPDVPYRFAVRAFHDGEGGEHSIECPDLPSCMSDGENIGEVIAKGIDAMRGWIVEGHPLSALVPPSSAA